MGFWAVYLLLSDFTPNPYPSPNPNSNCNPNLYPNPNPNPNPNLYPNPNPYLSLPLFLVSKKVGKWHLGHNANGGEPGMGYLPHSGNHGFERFFGLPYSHEEGEGPNPNPNPNPQTLTLKP
jgi:hypothetical protein